MGAVGGYHHRTLQAQAVLRPTVHFSSSQQQPGNQATRQRTLSIPCSSHLELGPLLQGVDVDLAAHVVRISLEHLRGVAANEQPSGQDARQSKPRY